MSEPRVQIMGADGEWHDVAGVVSVQLHEEEPANLAEAAFVSMRDFAVMQLAAAERVRDAPPTKRGPGRPRRDRPAWQSPYGPPRRR